MDTLIEPSTFDVIIVGTGLPESIVAGAAAVAGNKILHLDAAEFYGSHWASLSLEMFQEWASLEGELGHPPTPVVSSVTNDNQNTEAKEQPINGETENAQNGVHGSLQNECMPQADTWQPEAFPSNLELWSLPSQPFGNKLYSNVSVHSHPTIANMRSYALDLAGPRLPFCGGPLVDLLIRSGCHNYLEFKALEGSYLWQSGRLAVVPASRADIFQASMTLSEKRVVSRFFKKVSDYIAARAPGAEPESGELPPGDLGLEDAEAPFVDLLRRQQLPQTIREFVLYAIALIEEDQEEVGTAKISTLEGLERMTLYLSSIGRFGGAQTAFLYPMYGQGELPQAFCRIAAVKGATYVLRRPVDGILVDKESGACKGVRCQNGQLLWAQRVLLGPGYLPTRPQAAAPQSEQGAPEVAGASTQSTVSSPGPEEREPQPPAEGVPGGQGPRGHSGEGPSGATSSRGAGSEQDEGGGSNGLQWSSQVARCVCIVEGSLKEGKSTLLAVFPPKSLSSQNPAAVRCLQVGQSASVAPPGRFVIQFSARCPEGSTAEDLLRPAVEALFAPAESSDQSGEPRAAERESEAATSSSLVEGIPPEGGEAGGSEAGGEGQREAQQGAARGVLGADSNGREPLHDEPASSTRDATGAAGPEVPPGSTSSPENGSTTGDYLHANGTGGGVPAEDGSHGKPRLLWSVYLRQANPPPAPTLGSDGALPGGVLACGMPDESIDYRSVVASAEQLFGSLVPGEPFFPPAAPSNDEEDEQEGDDAQSEEDEVAQLLAQTYPTNGVAAARGPPERNYDANADSSQAP